MNDSEIVFNGLVGAYCGPLLVVRQFPNALSKLKECVDLTGLEIVRSISSSNDRAKYLYFQDYDRLALFVQHNLEYHLLDSLKRNDIEVGKLLENNLEESFVIYPRWIREWCATLATVLRIQRHKKYNIPLERNGVFIFCNKDDDLGIINETFNDYKEFPLAVVYLFDGQNNNNTNNSNKEREKEEESTDNVQLIGLKENKEKEKSEHKPEDNDVGNEEQKEKEEEEKHDNELVIPEYSDPFVQVEKTNEPKNLELGQNEIKNKENEDHEYDLYDEIRLLKEKKESEMNSKIQPELLELMKKYNVKYYVIDTNEDFCNSSELVKFVDDFVDYCSKKLRDNFEDLSSGFKGMKFSSKLVKLPEYENTLCKLMMLVCDELFVAQDSLMVNLFKSSLEHDIQALSQFLYGVYLYRYKKQQPKSEAKHEGEWVSEEDGKVYIDSYTSISHFDKSISLFNKYYCKWESFLISLLSAILGDYEEINKLLAKNSLLELRTDNDFGRSALCLELSSNRCNKIKRKKFQLMMAGRLYNQASLFNLSKRCYLLCLDEYEDWDIANEHFYSLLGDFDNNYLVNSLNILSNNYENKYSSLRSFEDPDKSLEDKEGDKGIKEIESNSEKEVYYLRKLMKLNGFQMGTKYLVSTPISGTFENYPTIYYQHHPLPLVEGETPFLVRIPILYLRKNGIIGTNVKLTTSYVDDLYEKLFENSFKDNTWHKCIKFDSIKDHVKKDFFTVSQSSRGPNYMVDTKLNLSLQLLNPLNITVGCYKFKILIRIIDSKPGINKNKYKGKDGNTNEEENDKNNINKNEDIRKEDNNNKYNNDNINPNNIDNKQKEKHDMDSINNRQREKQENKETFDPNLKWVECEIISDEDTGFQLKEYEKKNLLLTFRAQDVGSFKIVGLCWKLFDRVYFWSPLYTVGNKLKNYEFSKKITLNEFIQQRSIDKTLHFNVYEDRPKVNYYFKKVSDFTNLRDCVYFLKKDFEFVNNDNLLKYYTERYSEMTRNLDADKTVNENENLCLFDFFNGESSLVELSLQNLQDLPLSSFVLRFKVLGNFKTCPYPVGYKVHVRNKIDKLMEATNDNINNINPNNIDNKQKEKHDMGSINNRQREKHDMGSKEDKENDNNNKDNNDKDKDEDKEKRLENQMNRKNYKKTNQNKYDNELDKDNKIKETLKFDSYIDCTWNVINLPNVKVRDESLSEKMYEVFMKFKDDNFTLYNYSLSIYFFLEPIHFLDGIALIDGSFGVVPQTGLDLLVPFKLFLKIKKGPSFKSYYDYKDVVKVQVYNRSREEITQLDFKVNDKHVDSTDRSCFSTCTDTTSSGDSSNTTVSDHSNDTLTYSTQSFTTLPQSSSSSSPPTSPLVTLNPSESSNSIPYKSTMNFILPIEDPIVALTNKQVSLSERMPISIFWSTSERFGVFNGYVEYIEYKLLVKLSASPKDIKSNGNPAVVDLFLTLQNTSTEVVNSLSVSPLQDYESESLVSYIGETRKGVKRINPGSSVSLFYQIVIPLPGIYHFSPLSFKLDTTLDEKNVNYQDHVNTVIVYD